MNHEQLLSTVGATVGVMVALLTIALARAPGCRGLPWLGLVAFSAGSMCVVRTLAEGTSDDAVSAALLHAGSVLCGVLVCAAVRYEASDRDGPPKVADRLLWRGAVAAAALWGIASCVNTANPVRHGDGWTHVTYVDMPPGPVGLVGLAACMAVAVLLVVRYARRWRRGERSAGAHALALAGLSAAFTHDLVDIAWLHTRIHLAAVGLLWAVAFFGVALAGRFVEGARKLQDVSGQLERAMAERTAELATARAALVETKGLVTVGRLSAALAHEINNPVAVVAANVGYLRDSLPAASGDAAHRDDESVQALDDTLAALERIAGIVRQLGEAGELAMHGGTVFPVGLAAAVSSAVSAAQARFPVTASVDVDVPAALYVSSQEASVRQVVASLISSALEAGGCTGRVRVSAEASGDRVLLRVADDVSESDGVRRERRFRPFFETRPDAVRNDVGLSVSLALVRMLGAEIVLERSGESGSIVRLELRPAPTPVIRPSARLSTTAPRARVLVVDDDMLTRIGLRRLLGREFVIEEAATVQEALAHVESGGDELDAIVCDVVMPDGGAEALLTALADRAPHLAAATMLLTGGAIDERTGAFVAANSDRLVRKPVDVASLRAMLDRVRIHRSRNALPSSRKQG